MKTSNKKGQLNLLTPAILALVFAAIVLVFGLVITQALVDTTATSSATTTNESVLDVNNVTATTVANALKCGFSGFGIDIAINSSGGNVIDPANYTTTSTGGILTTPAGAAGIYNGTNWNVTYSYKFGTTACNAGNKTLVGLGTFADFWEIIVLAIVIAIVIGLLLIVFGGSARRR